VQMKLVVPPAELQRVRPVGIVRGEVIRTDDLAITQRVDRGRWSQVRVRTGPIAQGQQACHRARSGAR
jgi:hypothetical protein